MNSIRKSIVLAITGAALALGATAAFAVEDIVESARVGCKTEIDTLCKDVTPGAVAVMPEAAQRGQQREGPMQEPPLHRRAEDAFPISTRETGKF